MPPKIFKHICKLFIKNLIIFHLGISFIIFIADFTENLRGSYNTDIFKLMVSSLIMVPDIITQISPFIFLLSSFATIRGMVLRKEVDIFKSFGISIWQITIPLIVISIIWSTIIVAIISPFAVDMLLYKEKINIQQNENSQQIATATDRYIWLIEKYNTTSNIIATRNLVVKNNTTELTPVAFLEINKNKFKGAIFASKAIMEESKITFYTLTSKYKDNFYPEKIEEMTKNSSLSTDNLTSIASNPEMTKIWDFPKVITNLKNINFATAPYEIQFYNLLTLPILFIAMVLISIRFSLYDIRAGKNLFAIMSCISIGFIVYFFISFANVTLVSFNIHPLFAICSTKIIVLLVSINLLFSKEGL